MKEKLYNIFFIYKIFKKVNKKNICVKNIKTLNYSFLINKKSLKICIPIKKHYFKLFVSIAY